jgi:hypothetical protein
MKYFNTSRVGAAVFTLVALSATSGFAQQNRATVANSAAVAVQPQVTQQQMYNQGQANIQAGTQAHAQSQQTLSTLSQRNQAQLDAQTPKTPSSPTSTGNLH